MQPTTQSRRRWGRALIASLALVANLIVAGVPVLHAWAHDAGHGHGEVVPAQAAVDHSHDEVHPSALHHESLLTPRAELDLMPAAAAFKFAPGAHGAEPAPVIHAVLRAPSRAPPGPDQARAPPLA